MLKSEAILALDIGSSGIKLAEFEKGDDGEYIRPVKGDTRTVAGIQFALEDELPGAIFPRKNQIGL